MSLCLGWLPAPKARGTSCQYVHNGFPLSRERQSDSGFPLSRERRSVISNQLSVTNPYLQRPKEEVGWSVAAIAVGIADVQIGEDVVGPFGAEP